MHDRPLEPPAQPSVAFELTAIGRRRRRPDPGLLLVGLAVALVVAAILRPWDIENGKPRALTGPSAPAVAPTSQVRSSPSSEPAPSPSPLSAMALARMATERAVWTPTGHADSSGVAVGAGTSPAGGIGVDGSADASLTSIAIDGSWSVWTPVKLKAATGLAREIGGRLVAVPVTEICAGLPDLPSGAQVVALTASGIETGNIDVHAWQVVGWHDEPRDLEPLPGTANLVVYSVSGAVFLEEPAGRPWPDGRYEFVVGAPGDGALTVCLGRP